MRARRNRGFAGRALSMTPLIDIIFLLLLFFMLTSTFTRFAEVPLVHQTGGTAAEDVDLKRLFLRLSDQGLSLNGQPVVDTKADVTARLNDDKAIGLLSVTRDVTSQSLIETLTELRGIPGLNVVVLR